MSQWYFVRKKALHFLGHKLQYIYKIHICQKISLKKCFGKWPDGNKKDMHSFSATINVYYWKMSSETLVFVIGCSLPSLNFVGGFFKNKDKITTALNKDGI